MRSSVSRLSSGRTEVKTTEVCDLRSDLGEGPLWDPQTGVLYWLDSLGPTLFRWCPARSATQHWTLPGDTVGSLAVRASGGLILAMDRGIYSFDPDSGRTRLLAEPLAGTRGLRLNDGKVDPYGYFVTGAMNLDYRETQPGAMYRLSPALELSEILQGFTCFNGPCFSADGQQLFVTGRDETAIEAFDYGCDLRPSNARILLADCNPDGATVDAEGRIWSAQWDDGCILCLDTDGNIHDRIEFPGQVVSSVMFGGPDLDRIFVTTTAVEVNGVSPTAARSGRVLMVTGSGYRGRPEPMFKG